MKKIFWFMVGIFIVILMCPHGYASTPSGGGDSNATATATSNIGTGNTLNGQGGTISILSPTATGGNATGGNAAASSVTTNNNDNRNTNTNLNANNNQNSNSNKNNNSQGQLQGQLQGQAQQIKNSGNSTIEKGAVNNKNSQKQTAVGTVGVNIQNVELIQTAIVPSVPLPMVQGKIFDYTPSVQNFDGIVKIGKGELAKSVTAHKYIFNIRAFFGYSKIYLENVELVIVGLYNDSANKSKFRYKVIMEDGQDVASLMIGGAGAGIDGLVTGTGAGGVGIAHSGARPTFIVYEYELK